ncbi:hypothetical protein EV182_006086 [Spiromyces aspiralis]|uniref:Uncharacterized protein n=1 Tax=Spiromyces aspiralis TaxID=68401 RepID=A0ACC1HLN4_9FUNG|nr:hypothetical protein EV182_006086 [Spiromyces aspiralis]
MMTRAFAEYSKQLVDIEDDIPLVYSFFASILLGSGITLDKLKEASGLASGSDSAGRTIKEYVKVLAKQDFGDDLDKAKAKISETAGIDVSVI